MNNEWLRGLSCLGNIILVCGIRKMKILKTFGATCLTKTNISV